MTLKFEIKINPQYAELVRALSAKEYAELKESIKENGLHLPIIINQENTILDGHHRYQICNELDIDPKYEVKIFADQLEEKSFVIDINDKRRQLNDFSKAELAYESEKIESEKARLRQLSQLKDVKDNLPSLPLGPIGHNGKKGKTREIVTKKAGISQGTYERAKNIIKYGTELQKQKLRENKSSINKEYTKIRRDIKRHEYLENCKNSTITTDNNDNCRLILGDFREVANKELLDNSINLILTDPPYTDTPDNLELYKELALLAFNKLKPGGSIVFFVGHIILNKVIRIFDDSGLKYWWTFAVKHSGNHSKIYARHIFTQWKPMLMYVKGDKLDDFSTSNTIGDFIQSEAPAKILHEWQQSPVEAEYIIGKLTLATQTVLDPFMGSGTNGMVAIKLQRKFIGIEIMKNRFEDANIRLSRSVLDK